MPDAGDEYEDSDEPETGNDEDVPTADEKTCPDCGATVKPGASFCGECGVDLRVAPEPDSDEAGSDEREFEDRGREYDDSEREYDERESDDRQYDDRGRDYDDRRYDERESDDRQYDDRGREYDDRRYDEREYDDRRYDDRGRGYDDRRYDDRGYDTRRGKPDRAWTAGRDSNTGMAAISHILALFLWILGPILIYAIADDPFVKQNAANATNWQIMLTIYMIISFVLVIVLIGILFIFLLILLDIIFIIIATIKAADGEAWKYPLTPELL